MGKTILITGAGSGIGRDAAFAPAARGHRVVATTFDETQADALRAECQARRQALDVLKLDITLAADREQLRPLALDVLINNAAIGDSGSLAEVDVDRIRRVFEVNLFATLELTQIELAGMIEARDMRAIVAKIVKASEAKRPHLRYVAPWLQGAAVRLARVLGV